MSGRQVFVIALIAALTLAGLVGFGMYEMLNAPGCTGVVITGTQVVPFRCPPLGAP